MVVGSVVVSLGALALGMEVGGLGGEGDIAFVVLVDVLVVVGEGVVRHLATVAGQH